MSGRVPATSAGAIKSSTASDRRPAWSGGVKWLSVVGCSVRWCSEVKGGVVE